MANQQLRYKENQPGPYYVDHECIACDACAITAPQHFVVDEKDGHAFVFQQPKTKEERQLCEEAKEACPVEAIGNDGEAKAP